MIFHGSRRGAKCRLGLQEERKGSAPAERRLLCDCVHLVEFRRPTACCFVFLFAGRWMFSFRIRDLRVAGLRPSRRAHPLGPSMIQPVESRTRRM